MSKNNKPSENQGRKGRLAAKTGYKNSKTWAAPKEIEAVFEKLMLREQVIDGI